MKRFLVRVALFAINKLITLVAKSLAKYPNNETLKDVKRELEEIRVQLQNISINKI